jgi:hypothetical protein
MSVITLLTRRAPTFHRCLASHSGAHRLFTGSSVSLQQLPGEDGRTTHFGFETVAEAQKAARGNMDFSYVLIVLTFFSRCCLLLCSIIL